MLLIAHRGNVDRIVREKENTPEHLRKALDLGYAVEVDIWLTQDGWFLGHDVPEHKINEDFFNQFDPAHVWYHAKNIEALTEMLKNSALNCFWIHNDAYALTSKGYVWVHTRSLVLPPNSICVLPEMRNSNKGINKCFGICSDFVMRYK